MKIQDKETIYIDFDGTLLNTKRFKEAIYRFLATFQLRKSEVIVAYKKEYKDGKVSIERVIRRLFPDKIEAKKVLGKFSKQIISRTRHYLYKDAVPFLNQIDRRKFKVVLITLGDKTSQKNKVDNSDLLKYFDRIYYIGEEKWDILADIHRWNDKFIIIDDRADTIEKITKKFPRSLAIQIKRRSHDKDDPATNRKSKTKIISVPTLAGAKKIINSK